jgi:hypothetical protein
VAWKSNGGWWWHLGPNPRANAIAGSGPSVGVGWLNRVRGPGSCVGPGSHGGRRVGGSGGICSPLVHRKHRLIVNILSLYIKAGTQARCPRYPRQLKKSRHFDVSMA